MAKINRVASLKTILTYSKQHRMTFLLIVGCAFLAITADLLQPYLIKIVIDNHLIQKSSSFGFLATIASIYLGLSVVNFVFTYLQNNLLQYAGQSIVARLRKDLFAHISRLSMSFFDRFPIGSLVTHVSSDTEMISQFFTQVLLSLIRDGMTLVLIIVLMFRLDFQLACYCLIVLPVIAIIAALFRVYLKQTYQLSRSRLSRLIAFIAENLSGMSLIQAFHQEKEQTKRFSALNESYWQANLREIRSNVFFNRTFEILGNLSLVLIVWLGGMAVFQHEIAFGILYAFITYIRQFFQPINQITMQWNTFQSTTVSMERIGTIFQTMPEVEDAAADVKQEIAFDRFQGKVDFNSIDFTYESGQSLFTQLDLHIEAGEMVGIVGTTGAGKSTLIGLLNRFYDVKAGSIEIDDTDIRLIPQHTLHRTIGLIQQEPFLFSGSILDNVRLFREDITREQVIEACKFVSADSMIMRLNHQYDTVISERGNGLSAGERQLISFARIVIFKPKILILDEATANLDSHTEQLVQSALQAVSAGRTTVIIAHRLSTVKHADRILVMRHGEIVEQGTHEQLIKLKGFYEELYRHARHSTTEENASMQQTGASLLK
jgi:ATP-binding cassette subfamily B multidrug efflux pump